MTNARFLNSESGSSGSGDLRLDVDERAERHDAEQRDREHADGRFVRQRRCRDCDEHDAGQRDGEQRGAGIVDVDLFRALGAAGTSR